MLNNCKGRGKRDLKKKFIINKNCNKNINHDKLVYE